MQRAEDDTAAARSGSGYRSAAARGMRYANLRDTGTSNF
jgi:hypothetical protein